MGKSGSYEGPESKGNAVNILRDLRKLTADDKATVEDLLTPEFLKANTDFANLEEFLAELGTVDDDENAGGRYEL
jgi:hypothetical protein